MAALLLTSSHVLTLTNLTATLRLAHSRPLLEVGEFEVEDATLRWIGCLVTVFRLWLQKSTALPLALPTPSGVALGKFVASLRLCFPISKEGQWQP